MANYYTQFSTFLPLGSLDKLQKAVEIYADMGKAEGPEADELDFDDAGFEIEATEENGEKGLLIHDNGESGDVEQVLEFVRALCLSLDLSGEWVFTWASTCDKPRPDAFGGGSVTIDLLTGEEIVAGASVYAVHHTWVGGGHSFHLHRTFEGAVARLRTLVEENYCDLPDREREEYSTPLLAEIDAFKPGETEYTPLGMGDCFLALTSEAVAD